MIKKGNWWITDNNHSSRVTKQIITEEFHCLQSIKSAIHYCKQHRNAIDVGAWIGDSTWIMSPYFNFVYAFEADDKVYDCCVKNLNEKSVKNTKTYNVGLSDSKGTRDFYNKASGYQGYISANKEQLDKFNRKQVYTDLLDNFNFVDIDFIKIDVDSHESYVLLGSKKFFQNNNPVIMLETKSRIYNRQPDSTPNPVEILENYGYKEVAKVAKSDYVFERN